MKSTVPLFVSSFLMLSCAGAHAQAPARDLPAAALPAALEVIYEKAEGPGGVAFAPVIVVADTVPALANARAFDVPAVVKTRAQAREEQLAWFLYLSSVEETADTIKVSYMKPYNGNMGSVLLNRTDGKWVVAENKKMHSSSGARYFYGELYSDTKCRNGSDMAKRWNFYVDALDAMAAKRARTALADMPSNCRGEVFPDVVAYQQAKKIGLIK
jgi:hypothetical protein